MLGMPCRNRCALVDSLNCGPRKRQVSESAVDSREVVATDRLVRPREKGREGGFEVGIIKY